MMTRIVVDPEGPHNPLNAELFENDVKKFTVDANMWAVREGGALDSAVWSVQAGPVTVGSDTESSNVSTNNITVTGAGRAIVKVVLTLDSDGSNQVYNQYIEIEIKEIDKTDTKYWR